MFLRSKLHFYHLEALMWKTEKWHTLIFVHACAVYKTLAYVSSHLIITAALLGGIVITFYKLRWFMQKQSVHSVACSRYSRNDSWSEKIGKHRLRKPEHLAQGHIDENEWQSQNLKPVSLSMSLILFAHTLTTSLPPTREPQKFLENDRWSRQGIICMHHKVLWNELCLIWWKKRKWQVKESSIIPVS